MENKKKEEIGQGTAMTKEDFAALWKTIHLKVTDTYEVPPEILWVNGSTIGTLGNFSASTGKAKSLGYVHLNIEKPVRANTITIRLKGNTSDKDAFGQLIEVEAKAANKMELEKSSSKNQLRIIEAEFLETIK